ncbi:MAG TPA: ABC transporter ATP-binding protein [Streptosporangiaceae bacterium]|nr:ABC transporter ATP-binding protein [Streptosporangiaceae bacterium]
MTGVIEVSGLHKSFGHTSALDGLDLRVRTGEVHGFLGPNGAGKTTTIRVLLGLLRADAGTARLLGGDPWHDATTLHRRLAYVPGDVTLWPNLTGGEVIDLLGRLRGGLDDKRRAALLDRFDLDPKKKARTYSKGNRQKVALVAALASDAELLILDEPTAGLDPLMEAAFRACIEEERSAGRSVLLSSHILSEVEALCERVTIIRAGRTVESGTLPELRHLTRTSITAELSDVPYDLTGLPGVHDLHIQGTRVQCQVDSENLGEFLSRLTRVGVRSLESHPPSLEELFLRHYAAGATGVTASSAGSVVTAHGASGQEPSREGSCPRTPDGRSF